MKKTVVIGLVLAMSTAFAIGGDAAPTSAPTTPKAGPATTVDTSTPRDSDDYGQVEAQAASFADQYASDIPPE